MLLHMTYNFHKKKQFLSSTWAITIIALLAHTVAEGWNSSMRRREEDSA
jgi:hypothetical protein